MFRNRRNSADTLSVPPRSSVSHFKFIEIILRSVVFNFFFYTTAPLFLVAFSPTLFFKNPPFFMAKWTDGYVFWLLRVICDLTYKVEGLENIPSGKCIFASKHQSAWDTMAFQAIYPSAVYVLKKELLRIPIFGHFIKRFGMIAIDRKERRQALKTLISQARVIAEQDRKIVIFPEGSRSMPGKKSTYHKGVYLVYKDLKTCPVIPVALNSGVFWARRGFLRWPGVITMRFLKPLEPDLAATDFMEQLEDRIETASNELLSLSAKEGEIYE